MRQQPVAQPLRRRQRTVQADHQMAREALREARLQLRREVDLGHQHQRLAALRQGSVGGAQIDLGLAAAGGAMQQHRRARAQQFGHGIGLLGRQRRKPRRRTGRRRGGSLQARDAARQLGVVELAQLGRQHCQRQLADAALVVRRGEVDQRPPFIGHRRQRIQRRAGRAQGAGCGRRVRPAPPDQARHLTLAQRYTQQSARRERTLTRVVEKAADAGVTRRLHRHRQDQRLSHAWCP